MKRIIIVLTVVALCCAQGGDKKDNKGGKGQQGEGQGKGGHGGHGGPPDGGKKNFQALKS